MNSFLEFFYENAFLLNIPKNMKTIKKIRTETEYNWYGYLFIQYFRPHLQSG